MSSPRRLGVGWLAGGGKQVVFTIQAVTLGALLSAHLCLLHRYPYLYVVKTAFYRKQAKLMGC